MPTSKTSKPSLATQAYELLTKIGKPAKQAMAQIEKGQSALQGAYDFGIQAAALMGTWAQFKPIIERLEDNIRKNRNNLAVIFGAPKREKEDKQGNKYKVPKSVSNVKTEVKKAFEKGVALKDKEGNPRTFYDVHQELVAIRQAERDARETAEQAEQVANLKGDDKLRHEINEACTAIVKHCKGLSGAELAEWHKTLVTIAKQATGDVGKALEKATEPEEGNEPETGMSKKAA